MPYKFNVGKICVFEKVCKEPSSLTLIKLLGQNIIMTEEIVQKANKCVQTVMYNYVSTREGLYENLKTKLSMSFS